MTPPADPTNAEEIRERMDQILHGLELEPEETAEILAFANRELRSLLTPQTSHLVLGSYRDPYVRRLRTVENELNRRLHAYAFLLGDLGELESDRLPVFRIRFHLVATYADYVVAVYEQDAGGELTELGKISETPYFEKSYVLPRDYSWMTAENLDSLEDVVVAAARIRLDDERSETERRTELDDLLDAAREAGIDATRESVLDAVAERDADDTGLASYSWVHRNEFRLFELHGRCAPWSRERELRSAVDIVPSPGESPE